MKLLLYFAALYFCFQLLGVPDFLSKNSVQLQVFCFQQLPNSSQHLELLEAFLCGKNLSSAAIKEIFINTSLMHLIVVSGSHLILLMITLEYLFGKIISKTTLLILLFSYALLTGLQPPVLRSFFTILLGEVSLKRKLHWTREQNVFFASLCCLALFPNWIFSYSLILSLLAGLPLAAIERSALKKSILVYLSTFPALVGWGQLNPAGIIINWLFAPALASSLWFGSLIACLSTDLSNYILQLNLDILKYFSQHVKFITWGQSVDVSYLWGFVLMVFTLFHGLRLNQRRKNWEF